LPDDAVSVATLVVSKFRITTSELANPDAETLTELPTEPLPEVEPFINIWVAADTGTAIQNPDTSTRIKITTKIIKHLCVFNNFLVIARPLRLKLTL